MGCKYFTAGAACVLLLVGSAIADGSESLLADAAEKSDRDRVRNLIDQKVDVSAAQVDGMTALHWATHHDDLPMVKDLIDAGGDVKAINRYGVTPLSLACTNGNAAIVELLLTGGADPNGQLRGGETVLMTAARTGNLHVVQALLARGTDVNAKERRGQTALMWAAAEGHSDVVEALLAAGADFRTSLSSGYTPLLFAVREGRLEVVRILLKAGADVNGVMQPTKSPDRAAKKGTSPLILAIENGHFELAVVLLEAGADPNDVRTGFTPLHTITWVRKPNRGDGDDGEPPPTSSGKLTSLPFVKELVARGADVNFQLKTGKSGNGILGRVGATPFLMAAATADAPLMRTLVDLGADPLRTNAEQCTPLMAATGVGVRAAGEEAGDEPEVIEAIELALRLGVDINAVDANGETAMHGAAYRNHPKVVQLLADKGAKIDVWNQKNKNGWTPLLIAQGHRFGNFKPSAETTAAIEQVLLAKSSTEKSSE